MEKARSYSDFFHYGAPIVTVLFCLPHEAILIYGLPASPLVRHVEFALAILVLLFSAITVITWGITGAKWFIAWLMPRPIISPLRKSQTVKGIPDLAGYSRGVIARMGDVQHYANNLAGALNELTETLKHDEQQRHFTHFPLAGCGKTSLIGEFLPGARIFSNRSVLWSSPRGSR
jgi:hypothetical protein